MTEDATARRRRAGEIVVAVAATAAFLLLPLPTIDLPSISLPDLPGWLEFLLGPGKLAILLALIGLGALAEAERRRR